VEEVAPSEGDAAVGVPLCEVERLVYSYDRNGGRRRQKRGGRIRDKKKVANRKSGKNNNA
jgi:hypothetical protein